jgi:hypothetical protein
MASIILFGPILVLWWVMARSRFVGATVAGIIVVLGVLTELGRWLIPIALLEISLAGFVLALLTITIGRRVERRRLGPSTGRRAGWAHGVLVVFGILVLCVYVPYIKPTPFFPDAALAGPLPPGLTAVEEEVGEAGSCGTGLCGYTLTVTARPGESGTDLYKELSDHIRTGCRPTGWLIDRRTECVSLRRPIGNTVGIHLTGSREPYDDRAAEPD